MPPSDLISIIVPMHNVESFLPALFRSLDRQTYQDWEVVAVDDGSTDGSLALAREYADRDPRIRVYAREKASGTPLVPSLEGERHARGQWICPLDADDWVSDDYLAAMLDRATQTGADLVYPLMLNHRKGADLPPSEILDRSVIDVDSIYRGRDLVIHTLYEWKFGCNGILCRREVYLRALTEVVEMEEIPGMPGGRPHTAIPYIDEVSTRLLMYYARRVAFAPGAIYHYISNPGSVVSGAAVTQFRGLGTDWYLREAIRRHYGADSPEWRRMHLQLGCNLVGKMITYRRLLTPKAKAHQPMTPEAKAECLAWLRYTYTRLPWPDLRCALSPAYYHLLRLGFRPALHLFPLLK